MMLSESSWLAVRLSSRPSLTSQLGPPLRTTASRAAITTMSAQETTPGQRSSSASLASSMTSNERRELMLDSASFSPAIVGVASISTDPSHPLTKQSWNWRRMTDATLRTSRARARAMVPRTMPSASGHVTA
uniref:Pco123006 n=1 Tax=Arundo donax TaxID=35708 RepID=A0A0A9DJL8_ARUDO